MITNRKILTLFIVLNSLLGYGQEVESFPYKFQSITLKEGLSNLNITSIERDNMGYTWIATYHGLNRYDGHSFTHYMNNNDENSLYHDHVTKLYKNSEGKLFCSTDYGVNMFDSDQNKIYRIKSNNEKYLDYIDFENETYGSSNLGGLFIYNVKNKSFNRLSGFSSNMVVNNLIAQNFSGIWGLSTNNKKLVNYNPNTNSTREFAINGKHNRTQQRKMIKVGNLLIISGNKFHAFDLSTSEFTEFPKKWDKLNTLSSYTLNFIKKTDKHTLLIGSRNRGLFVFNLENNTLVNINKNNSELYSNAITTIFQDKENNIWLGTFDRGINISFKNRNIFNSNVELNNFIADKFVTAIEIKNDTYYIGTRLDGLYIYNSKTNEKKRLNTQNSKLKDNLIEALMVDSENKLWIGGENIIQTLNIDTEKIEEIKPKQTNEYGVVSFCEQNKNIIIGTFNQGFLIFNNKGKQLKQVFKLGSNITKILPYGDNSIILSSYGHGIFSYNLNSDSYRRISDDFDNNNHIFKETLTLHLDNDNILWAGNFNNGLYQLNLNNDSLNIYTEKEGLVNNDVVGIVEDTNGYLWLSTSNGLCKFDKKKEFTKYLYNDGLTNIQFHQKAAIKDNNGTVFFGGNYGLTFFDPNRLNENNSQIKPNIILNSLKISNKEIFPDDETKILAKVLNSTEQIQLTHLQNSFSLNFHAFNYIAPNKISYYYSLKNIDSTWYGLGQQNYVSFSNLEAGEYTFMVKAKSSNDSESNIAELKINIKPSPYFTTTAFLIYIILLMFLLTISSKIVKRVIEKQNILKEKNITIKKESEIVQAKMKFMSEVTKEIRTALTSIKGNVNLFSNELSENGLNLPSVNCVKTDTERLTELTSELLLSKKVESKFSKLKIEKRDIIKINNKLIQPFKFGAYNKGVNIRVKSFKGRVVLPIDRSKYERIINILISNSLKLSNGSDSILIKVEKLKLNEVKQFFENNSKIDNNSYVKISVGSNNKLYDYSLKKNISGLEIDLAKRLIEELFGKVKNSDFENSFSFVLSTDEKTFKNEKWLVENDKANTLIDSNKNRTTVLIIDDDEDFNKFISKALEAKFNIIRGFNGKEGIVLAQKHKPDLIVSDIDMPELDGLLMCKLLRNDKTTSNIPVILMSSAPDSELEIRSYQQGADNYIAKPFELDILTAQINNLISMRDNIYASNNGGTVNFNLKKASHASLNFAKEVEKIVANNYQSSELNVQFLANKMNMSRTSFYRKFIKIMDISPKNYITKYQINKSIELIESGNENFGEISYLCGFSSQSNFSVIFKKEKGVTPMQYKKSLL